MNLIVETSRITLRNILTDAKSSKKVSYSLKHPQVDVNYSKHEIMAFYSILSIIRFI